MITPQLTEQYGHVERVSLARAIFSVRSCANAGFRSNPKTAAAAPPMVVNFRKSRRVRALTETPPLRQAKEGKRPPAPPPKKLTAKASSGRFQIPAEPPNTLYKLNIMG